MPFSAVDFLQALTTGIPVGSAHALMWIGLGINLGSMNVINFAQGDFSMLGSYAAFYLVAGYGLLAFRVLMLGRSQPGFWPEHWSSRFAGCCTGSSWRWSPGPVPHKP
jgi:hypothetical protein